MTERVGVFICDCGGNIADVVDTRALSDFARNERDVVMAEILNLWCSEQGRARMKELISQNNLTRIVVAACSPKQHELTFRRVLASAGINPYLLAMANVREQVAWVTKDKNAATRKAVAQLKSAIARVKLQEPLEKSEIECKKDFLVIGAGISGVSAAIALAQKNRKVHLVEKEPWIGGKVIGYENVFPKMECATCMVQPKLDEVLNSETIELHTSSEVENVKGFFGNFEAQIRTRPRFIDRDKCIGCGACYDVCPVKVKNKFNGNLSERRAIYTAFSGVLPNIPVIDEQNCLRFKGQDCRLCRQSCPLGAVDYEQKEKTFSAGVGAIVVATGFDFFEVSKNNNFSSGLPDVLGSFQFERMLSSTGPTDGRILKADNTLPSSIAFVHCAGSRDKNYNECCSAVCCAATLKMIKLAGEKVAGVKIYEIFSDWCLPGKSYQEFYDKLPKQNIEFIRVSNPNEIKISRGPGALKIICGDKTINADMAVLSQAMVSVKENRKLAAALGVPVDADGFFCQEHDKVSPASTVTRGIYVAGCVSGPKDIPSSVLQAQAAAGLALGAIIPGEKLELEVATSKVDEELCGACRTCTGLCPYEAISYDKDKRIAVINEILCRGCGICAASCPAGAIKSKHFTTEQIFSEIRGLLL